MPEPPGRALESGPHNERLLALPVGSRPHLCLTALRRFTAVLLGLTALGKAVDRPRTV